MAQRITEKDLQNRIDILNRMFKYKRTYIKSRATYKGKEFHLGGAYGGYSLELTDGMFNYGYVSKKELYEYINGMIKGINMYKNRNKKR